MQLTKTGWAFVFDRVTGKPVWPIEERPVPASDVPGEKASLTQPVPTKPPAFERQGVTLDDAFDLTPELKAEAQAALKKYRIGPIFTPPSLEGTVMRPGTIGGANWGGGAIDPATGIIYIKSTNQAFIAKIVEARAHGGGGCRICRRQRRKPGYVPQRPPPAEAALRTPDRDRFEQRRDRLAGSAGRQCPSAEQCGVEGLKLPSASAPKARRAASSPKAA